MKIIKIIKIMNLLYKIINFYFVKHFNLKQNKKINKLFINSSPKINLKDGKDQICNKLELEFIVILKQYFKIQIILLLMNKF